MRLDLAKLLGSEAGPGYLSPVVSLVGSTRPPPGYSSVVGARFLSDIGDGVQCCQKLFVTLYLMTKSM